MSDSARLAGPSDADSIARLLHAFSLEYDDPTPGPEVLEDRVRRLLDEGDTDVLLIGEGPDGLAVLRFRTSIWVEGAECYLAELYVAPERRGRGLGKALMQAALEQARRPRVTTLVRNRG